MDYAAAGVTVDDVRLAACSLTSNPMYPPLRSQLRELAELLHRTDDLVAHEAMAEGTLQLFRALVEIGAHAPADADRLARGALVAQVKRFIRAHLTRHGLSPRFIADAHHVSLRPPLRIGRDGDFARGMGDQAVA